MKKQRITTAMLDAFEKHLTDDEKSKATVEKYMRDVRNFASYASKRQIDKTLVLGYKSALKENYAVTSANSMLASVNAFFRFAGWYDCCAKQLRVQKKTYCTEKKELSKDEYFRLIRSAEQNRNNRLSLVIQTICGTGIRVSELKYITVEAVAKGEVTVSCKSKTRTVFIVSALRKKLLRFANEQKITSGQIFVTKSGKSLDRCNIWREMKQICFKAKVSPEKVFPHNLRHLFARTFYSLEKDIAKLADILGHTSINTTRIYIVTTGAEHKRKLEKMHMIL